MRRSHSGERGVAVIEFALIAPILFILILAIVDFGFRFQTMATYDNAAQAAARSMTIDKEQPAAAETAAADAGIPSGVASAAEITFTGGVESCSATSDGTYPNVTVTIHNDKSPYLIGVIGSTFGVTGTAVARCMG